MKRAVHHSAVWLVFPLWALFVAITFSRVALLLHYNHQFLAHAQVTQGQVEKKIERLADHFGNDRLYALIYNYQVGNVHGRIRTGVDQRTYEQVQTGGPIAVVYSPTDPRQHCLNYAWELADLANAPIDDFAVGLSVFIPGLGLIWYFARRNRIHTWLLTKGSETWGEVIEVRKSHTRQGSYTYLVIRFASASGREIEGRTSTLPNSERIHWQQGDPIQVFYNPKKPELFAVELQHPLDGLDEEPTPAPFWQTIFA